MRRHEPRGEVRESRFGRWFLGTRTWFVYVLCASIDELEGLLGPRTPCFPEVLDAGCGPGAALPELERRFRSGRLVAVDLDTRLLGRARESARSCSGRVELRVGDLRKLDLPDASFDLVFCHQTLHHLRHQDEALREFWRVLRPGGSLLLTESCRSFIGSLSVRALFRHPMEVQRSAEQWVELVRAAGFEVAEGAVSTTSPFWSLPAFGLLGRRRRRPPEPTQLHLAARRPAGREVYSP